MKDYRKRKLRVPFIADAGQSHSKIVLSFLLSLFTFSTFTYFVSISKSNLAKWPTHSPMIFSKSWDVFCPDTIHNHSTTVALVVIAVKKSQAQSIGKFSYTVCSLQCTVHGVHCIEFMTAWLTVSFERFFLTMIEKKTFPSRELLGLRSRVGGWVELLKYWIYETECEIVIRLPLTSVTIWRHVWQLLQTVDSSYNMSTTLIAVKNKTQGKLCRSL